MNSKPTMLEETWQKLSSTLTDIVDKAKEVNGIFVECGVYQGTTARILGKAKDKELYLFDSWEGLPETTEHDNNDFYHKGDWSSDLKVAQDNLYVYRNVHFMKGWFPERFNEIKNVGIALLHLDCSLYESTKACLDYFWDQVSPGGYVVCNYHDGYSVGPEKAFKEFFEGKREITEYPAGVAVVIK
jgi:O-methyltransferase